MTAAMQDANRGWQVGPRPPLLLLIGALLCLSQVLSAGAVELPDQTFATLVAYAQELDASQPIPAFGETVNLTFSAPNAGLNVDDPSVSDLRAYARTLPFKAWLAKADPNAEQLNAADNDVYLDLGRFAGTIAANASLSIKDQPKLAEADNAFDALREYFQKQNSATPPESPKAAPPPPPAKADVKAPVVGTTFVGSKACLGCHASQTAAYSATLMGRLQKQGKLQCETCHGPGSAHVNAGGGRGVGGIISFRADDTSRTVEENNGICLTCHERGQRAYWPGSVHEVRGLACTNCHTVMANVSAHGQLKTAFEPETCFQCHKDRRAQMFRSAHMPMREGKVTCSDCHNPHGSVTEALIWQNSINDNCYKCHAEKRGPFLFEHAPVRENCLNCHDPHGSINEYSLKMSQPRLCYECHTIGHTQSGPGSRNSVLLVGNSCVNCHTLIHGSNSPAGAVFQR